MKNINWKVKDYKDDQLIDSKNIPITINDNLEGMEKHWNAHYMDKNQQGCIQNFNTSYQ